MSKMRARGPSTQGSHLATAAMIAITAVWGFTFFQIKDATELLPALPFVGDRFLIAALVLGVFRVKQLRALGRQGWIDGSIIGLFLTLGYVAQTIGLEQTSVSNAGFITGLFVVFTPLLVAVRTRKLPTAVLSASLALCLLGTWLLAGGSGSLGAGDLLVLVGAFGFACHIVAINERTRDHDVASLVVVQLLVCGVIASTAALFAGQQQVPTEGSVWVALLVTAVVASAVGFVVQTIVQQHLSPTRVALILTA